MFRPASRRLAGLATRNSALLPQSVNRIAVRRGYADHAYQRTSDLPWLVAAVGFTVPSAYWLIQSSPAPAHHDEHLHPHAQVTKTEEKEDVKEEKEDKEEDEQEDYKPKAKDDEGEQPKSGKRGAGKPEPSPDDPQAEEKSSGQVNPKTDRPRSTVDIAEKNSEGMPKTPDTVTK